MTTRSGTLALFRLLAVVLLTAPASAQRRGVLPLTGLDFSGVDQFWKIVDLLSSDREPDEAQWSALFGTPGYRLAQVNLGRTIRRDMDLALKPSRRSERDSVVKAGGDRATVLDHFARAVARRAELMFFRDSLARSSLIPDAVAIAARSLPVGATRNGAPPLVAFAVFRDDNFSLPQGVVLDLLSMRGTPLAVYLAHEFHHSYTNRLARPVPMDAGMSPEGMLRQALYDLRNEGLADLIDKPHPFTSPNPGVAAYVTRYNSEYARTPEVMHRLDSLLSAAASDAAQMEPVSMAVADLFWSNGHPNGAYVAREIQETFGVDSLRAADLDPAAFLRIYAAAERVRGRPAPLSPKAWTVIDALDVKYWKR